MEAHQLFDDTAQRLAFHKASDPTLGAVLAALTIEGLGRHATVTLFPAGGGDITVGRVFVDGCAPFKIGYYFGQKGSEDFPMVIASPLFQGYLARLAEEGITPHVVEIRSAVFRGKPSRNNLLFADLLLHGTKSFPEKVQLQNNAAAVLVILECEGTDYTVLVNQHRTAVAHSLFCEIPAGKVERGQGFSGTAANELKEELGVVFTPDEITALLPDDHPGVAPSCGAITEFIKYFVAHRTVTLEQLEAMNGRLTGVTEEGEEITLRIVPLEEIFLPENALCDGKAHTAMSLYAQSLTTNS